MARRVLGLALGAGTASAALALALTAGPALAAARGTAAGGVSLALAAGGDTVDAPADPSPTGSGDPGTGLHRDRLVLRLQRGCDRIPNLLRRADNLEERLAGDADTRGSLAWLQARIAQAEAAGKTDRAAALEARLKVRQDVQQILPARVEQLKKAQSGICVDVAAATAATT